jgi:hypothetical protein
VIDIQEVERQGRRVTLGRPVEIEADAAWAIGGRFPGHLSSGGCWEYLMSRNRQFIFFDLALNEPLSKRAQLDGAGPDGVDPIAWTV